MVDVLGDTTDPRLLDIWGATETLSPDIPFLFLSSSAQTKHITTIYDSFRLTCRFISGIDAGSRRDNIFYEIRPFIKPSDSYADLAIFFEPHLLPVGVGEDDRPFHPKDIQDIPCNPHLLPRMIIFVKTLEDCLSAQYALFMLLPRQFGGLIEIYQPPGIDPKVATCKIEGGSCTAYSHRLRSLRSRRRRPKCPYRRPVGRCAHVLGSRATARSRRNRLRGYQLSSRLVCPERVLWSSFPVGFLSTDTTCDQTTCSDFGHCISTSECSTQSRPYALPHVQPSARRLYSRNSSSSTSSQGHAMVQRRLRL